MHPRRFQSALFSGACPASRVSAFALMALAVALAQSCTVRLDVPRDAFPSFDSGRADGSSTDARPTDTGPGDTAAPDASQPDTSLAETIAPDVSPRDALSDVPDIPLLSDTATADVPGDDGGLADGGQIDGGVSDASPTDGVGGDTDGGPADAAQAPELLYCPWEAGTLPVIRGSRILLDEDFESATTELMALDRGCDEGAFPHPDFAERAYVLAPEADGPLVVETRCHGWDCDVLIAERSCLISDVMVCGNAVDDEHVELQVRAGEAYLLVVEPHNVSPLLGPSAPDQPDEPGPFDLHIAMNRPGGREPCPVDGELRVSDILRDAACSDERPGFRELTITGDTTAPDARDDVFLDCVGPGVPPDTTGGAPDALWRLVMDPPDRTGRLVHVDATLTNGWSATLGVTGAPCGAADAIVDCTRGVGGLAVEDIYLFDRDTVFIVLDGVGDEALEGGAAGPYALRLFVEDTACR